MLPFLLCLVLSCKTWNFVKPEAWLARPGLNSFKILPLSYLWCCKVCTQQQSLTVRAASRYVRSKVFAALLCLWRLNKTIYLISLTISVPMWLPWQSPQGKHERSQVSHCPPSWLALCAHDHPVHTNFTLWGKVRNVLCSKYSSSPYSSELPSYNGMMGLTSGQNTWASFPSCPAVVVSGIPNFWRAARNSKWYQPAERLSTATTIQLVDLPCVPAVNIWDGRFFAYHGMN